MIASETRYKTHFLISQKGDKLVPIKTSEIAYIYTDVSIVKAITFDQKSYTMQYSLDELINILKPVVFYRANRKVLNINLN